MSLSTPPLQRRLSARRGSASAFDPFNAHAELNHVPSRACSSTLTLVRVASPQTPDLNISLHDPPTSPVLSQRRLHRRPAPGATSPPPPAPEPSTQQTRLSFAFSSFGSGPAPGGPSRDRVPSPSSSPRLRPASPRLSSTNSFQSKPRLSPDQLVDLARQSTSPRSLAQAAATPLSGPLSPTTYSHSPVLTPTSAQNITPATFTPLPDDIYLPFIDRPSEVASLISSPPDAKLFALLAQTFGQKKDPDPTMVLQQPSDLPTDPTQWTYRHLVFHLTKVDRDVAPDTIWAYASRKCIISHSELIWERVKGALGIPPELDVDWDFNRNHDAEVASPSGSDGDSIRTEDISDDEGKAARGHWSDWDAIMDSPAFSKRGKRWSTDSSGAGHEGITFGAFSPPTSALRFETEPDTQLVIEPLIAPPPSFSTAPPPLSLPLSLSAGLSDGLGDIAEGAEEEEEEAQGTGIENKSSIVASTSDKEANHLVASQIQGLKISTSPLPVSHYDTSPMLSPISPPPSFSSAIAVPGSGSSHHHPGAGSSTYVGSRPHSRSSSFSSIGPFRRSESGSNLTVLLSSMTMKNNSSVAGSDGGDTSSVLSELHFGSGDGMVGGDFRAAGTPLFPSNFSRLAGAPTLRRPSYTRTRTYSHGASTLRESWGTKGAQATTTVGGGGNGSGSE